MIDQRGLDNNNPLNIRHNDDTFQGEVVPSRDPLFKQFISMNYGYRAAFQTLGTYLEGGCNTIDKIIKRWAPPKDHNNTESYIINVAKRSGVNRHTILSNTSGDQYIKIVAAMCYSENGVPANMTDVLSGFVLQSKIRRV
jgi:hypothetical protein